MTSDFHDIPAPAATAAPLASDQAVHGPRIPPQQQILLYSSDEWEAFAQEWVHCCLKTQYLEVRRYTGAGDLGIDIAGFADAQRLNGIWDNYQCKHYDDALTPTDIWSEIGKILWYSFKGEYRAPRKHFFVAPHGTGTKLSRLLDHAEKLKSELLSNWAKHCQTQITSRQEILLEGDFLKYVDAFDFSIFDAKTALQLIDDHRTSPYHTSRFGGGLPTRPGAVLPPDEIAASESHYVAQLLGAYADHKKEPVADVSALTTWPTLNDHFKRQREAFYHAEGLRIFARETVPPGTFESLQEDIYDGVIDTHNAVHADGYVRVLAVTKEARSLHLTSNALLTRASPKDRDGICHQLANEDWFTWTK